MNRTSTVSNEWDNIVPDLPMNDLDNDGDISIVDDGGNNNIPDLPQFALDNDDEIVLVGGVPSISCHGFQPLLAENFYENFAFQLLPTMPHITLCGSSFHHVSCTSAHFKLQPGSEDSMNSQYRRHAEKMSHIE